MWRTGAPSVVSVDRRPSTSWVSPTSAGDHAEGASSFSGDPTRPHVGDTAGNQDRAARRMHQPIREQGSWLRAPEPDEPDSSIRLLIFVSRPQTNAAPRNGMMPPGITRRSRPPERNESHPYEQAILLIYSCGSSRSRTFRRPVLGGSGFIECRRRTQKLTSSPGQSPLHVGAVVRRPTSSMATPRFAPCSRLSAVSQELRGTSPNPRGRSQAANISRAPGVIERARPAALSHLVRKRLLAPRPVGWLRH